MFFFNISTLLCLYGIPRNSKSNLISVTGLFAFLFHGEYIREDSSQFTFVFRSVSFGRKCQNLLLELLNEKCFQSFNCYKKTLRENQIETECIPFRLLAQIHWCGPLN